MGFIHLSVGQCGNQIAAEYYSHLMVSGKESTQIIQDQHNLRCIFVDTEGKVLKNICRKKYLRSSILNESVISSRRGRGSNWAYGYYGSHQEGSVLSDSMEQLRYHAERSDYLSGVMMFHSLAGGTGSGLGSRLAEEIRNEFGLQCLVNCVVVPYASGESPMQNYNSLLCLSHLQDVSDGILLLSNDAFSASIGNTTTAQNQQLVNKSMAQNLRGLFSPCSSLYIKRRGLYAAQEPCELMRSLCPMACAKLIRTAHVMRSADSDGNVGGGSWSTLSDSLCTRTRRTCALGSHASGNGIRKTLAAVVCARGPAVSTLPRHLAGIKGLFTKTLQPVSWNPYAVDIWLDTPLDVPYLKSSSRSDSLTLAFNSACVSDYLCQLHFRVASALNAGAYLHWLDRHGCDRQHVSSALDVLQAMVTDYKDLSAS